MKDTLPDLVIGSDPTTYEIHYIHSQTRYRHCYVLGKTGMGKSTLFHHSILTDIQKNKATFFFDPGDLTYSILETLPEKRIRDVKFFSLEHPIPYNPLQAIQLEEGLTDDVCDLLDRITLQRSATMALTERMRRILGEVIPKILEHPNPSLAEIPTYLIENQSSLTKSLGYKDEAYQTSIEGIIDRLNPFLQDSRLRRIVCSPHQLNFDDIIDNQQIFIASFAGLDLGMQQFLGTLLFHGLQRAVIRRKPEDRLPLAVYIDEFPNFIASKRATHSFQILFNQGRRHLVSLTIAHQDFGIIPDELLNSVISNVATCIGFSCGYREAMRLSNHFARHFTPEDFQLLPQYHALVRTENYLGEPEMYRIETFPPPKPLRTDINQFFYQAIFEEPERKESQELEEPQPPERRAKPDLDTKQSQRVKRKEKEDADQDLDQYLHNLRQK